MAGEWEPSEKRSHTQEIQRVANLPGADLPEDLINVRVLKAGELNSLISSLEDNVAKESTLSDLLDSLLDDNDEISIDDSGNINVDANASGDVDVVVSEIGGDNLDSLGDGVVEGALQNLDSVSFGSPPETDRLKVQSKGFVPKGDRINSEAVIEGQGSSVTEPVSVGTADDIFINYSVSDEVDIEFVEGLRYMPSLTSANSTQFDDFNNGPTDRTSVVGTKTVTGVGKISFSNPGNIMGFVRVVANTQDNTAVRLIGGAV